MQNKEKVFVNKIEKKFSNNEKVYYNNIKNISDIENIDYDLNKINNKNINQKINAIFNSKNYVYKADVLIKTSEGNSKKTIIGRNTKFLITSKNELIAIKDIIDIINQEKNS